eukprot:COSAG01_NODE_29323_length_640_cov_1.146026_1_plen_36_part_10
MWNGVKELRKYRQPKIQPRDAVIQGSVLLPGTHRLR